MPALFRTDINRRAIVPVLPADEIVAADVEPSLYLTDGLFLFRFVGSASCGSDEMVELEDCYSLRTIVVPLADLHERNLRIVIPE